MRTLIFAALGLLLGGSAAAAPQGDWPCVQRKVAEITAAAIGAPPDLATHTSAWANDEQVAGLVAELTARRLPIDEAQRKIEAFSAAADKAKAALPLVLAGLFDRLNAERGGIIDGIERYGRKQKMLAERLREEMRAFDVLRADASADPLKVSEASDRLLWDTRIFDERQQSLSYVCEVPVLIEQRLFALGRTILEAMK